MGGDLGLDGVKPGGPHAPTPHPPARAEPMPDTFHWRLVDCRYPGCGKPIAETSFCCLTHWKLLAAKGRRAVLRAPSRTAALRVAATIWDEVAVHGEPWHHVVVMDDDSAACSCGWIVDGARHPGVYVKAHDIEVGGVTMLDQEAKVDA